MDPYACVLTTGSSTTKLCRTGTLFLESRTSLTPWEGTPGFRYWIREKLTTKALLELVTSQYIFLLETEISGFAPRDKVIGQRPPTPNASAGQRCFCPRALKYEQRQINVIIINSAI